MNRVLIYYRHSFARRTVKEIPKVTSDTTFDQELFLVGENNAIQLVIDIWKIVVLSTTGN